MRVRLTAVHDAVILDACSVINLYASRRMADILNTVEERPIVATYVRDVEATEVRLARGDDQAAMSEQIDLNVMVSACSLEFASLQSADEEETFVNFAAALGDDGESITSAIAFHRGWAVATDDRKAAGLLARAAPHIQVVSTPELLRHWAAIAAPSPDEVRAALSDIRTRAHYEPPRSHPLYGWWQAHG